MPKRCRTYPLCPPEGCWSVACGVETTGMTLDQAVEAGILSPAEAATIDLMPSSVRIETVEGLSDLLTTTVDQDNDARSDLPF